MGCRSTLQGGLTLAELVLAVGLLALILLGSIHLFTLLFSSSTRTSSSLLGSQFALQKLEEVVSSGGFANTSGTIQAYTVDAGSKTNFYYQIRSQPMSARTSDPSETYLGGYLVMVSVYWNSDSPTQFRLGRGLQSTQAQRFVYPRVAVP